MTREVFPAENVTAIILGPTGKMLMMVQSWQQAVTIEGHKCCKHHLDNFRKVQSAVSVNVAIEGTPTSKRGEKMKNKIDRQDEGSGGFIS